MESSSVNNLEGFADAIESAAEQMNTAVDTRELIELQNRMLVILNQLEIARMLLADALDGRKCDPSWIRPLPMSEQERRDACIQAHDTIRQILNDAANA